ncbi:MAG: N-6 DNA methylase [Candidatus Acidiferrales bacterium]
MGGETKFFVEAKAPSEELDAAKHIIQAKTYAWNTKQVFFVVLTDFEEFRFYDASIQPDPRRPDEGLLLKLKHTDYVRSLKKLWEFSKERVLAGSLDAMVPRDRRTQRLRLPVDAVFLDEMTGWRAELAKNVYKNNAGLTARQLNEIVQRLLDRIVFVRIAEDRHVIEKNQLRDAVEEWKARGGKFHIFEWLNDLFHRINEDFNGEIFKPHSSEKIRIDSGLLARIIERLYPPQSPYRFDVIGVELLGSIYERYLGDTIRVTARRVFVEEKPEVRKAGGVYYTPEYIVDYIVKNTVGRVIEGRTPKQIEEIRILDPACGSGSFLIGAFQCLIDYHVRYLSEHPSEAQGHALFPDIIRDQNGEPRLSVVRKAEILRNNLFGVDIDPQAVEVTMMSLYLKALEGERSQLPPKQHLLPELKFNVLCGNSLIGPDIYEQGTLFGDAERDTINAFDWNSDAGGFGRIMDQGGFNCVIGNPPYGADYTQAQKAYFQSKYTYKKGKPETYIYFLERGIAALASGGMLGYITPNAWLSNYYGVQLRRFMFLQGTFEHVVDLEPTRVFQEAVVDTAITIFRKGRDVKTQPKTRVWRGTEDHRIVEEFTITQGSWASDAEAVINVQASPTDLKLLIKLEGTGKPLETLAEYSQGVIPYKTSAEGRANRYISANRRGREWLPLIENASQVRRYDLDVPTAFIRYGRWLWCAREARFFAQPKILFHRLRKKLPRQLIGAYDDTGAINRHSLSNLILRPGTMGDSLLAILGLFNSSLANWWFVKRYGLLMEVGGFKVGKMPLPPRWGDASKEIIPPVERMLELHKRKHSPELAPSALQRLEREIAAADSEIDNLVFELYLVTPDERGAIERPRSAKNPQRSY